jgi:hypothetical protein
MVEGPGADSEEERDGYFRPLKTFDLLPKIVPPQKSGTIFVRDLSVQLWTR